MADDRASQPVADGKVRVTRTMRRGGGVMMMMLFPVEERKKSSLCYFPPIPCVWKKVLGADYIGML